MSVTLSEKTLLQIAGEVAVPSYDRAALKGGILHFGVGNFHRAHQAVYLDDLFALGEGHDYAIVGAGILPAEAAAREKLLAQDLLTTVVEQEKDHVAARVTGAMVDYLPIGDAGAIVQRLADPAIRIVSLTITEGGYFIDSDGRFDPSHPAIAADGANPDAPKTVFGLIVAGLKARRAAGEAPFTVMCCDNIPHNGAVTRAAVAGTAELSDPELARWIDESVAFPNSMVDRITPATSAREIEHLREAFGIEDRWPVYCEAFRQWVLEDRFPAGRPALEKVGVTFVEDVAPYELMKIRILNGGHAAIAYPAILLDIHFVHEAMEHPLIRAFLEKLTKDEIIPVVPPVPDTSLEDYRQLIDRRFSNPKIGDTVARLALDGSNRQPKFIVPTIRDRLREGGTVDGLALVSALWARALGGASESGREMPLVDPNLERLRPVAQQARTDPSAWLSLREIYGETGDDRRFADAFARQLASLYERGVEETLAAYIG